MYGSKIDTWYGAQFHFHAASEHTIDGVRQDFEMKTVHYPNGATAVDEPFLATELAVMFSVENYDKSVTDE